MVRATATPGCCLTHVARQAPSIGTAGHVPQLPRTTGWPIAIDPAGSSRRSFARHLPRREHHSRPATCATQDVGAPPPADHPTVACGYDRQGDKEELDVDGILGIGRGMGDLVSQLKQQGWITENVVGHCLSSLGGGYLFFGGDNVPSTGVTWLPMLQEYT
ncbi:hypothetical protein ZWY2020_052971 [Hordeum vulgare]|nr:hypothetical protein ZWY2020_052971 [Hordeum vulgare]